MLRPVFSRLTSLQRGLLSALFALLGYGAWAYMVNFEHGFAAAVKAAFVQGSYSFALTFVMSLMIESLYRKLSLILTSNLFCRFSTAFIVCGIIFSSSWWLNVLAGTPEIFKTVILGYFIGAVYTFIYTFNLANNSTVAPTGSAKKY